MAERDVDVLVPVLGRPRFVRPLRDSLLGSVTAEAADGWEIHLTFVCSPEDEGEIREVRRVGLEPLIVPWPAGPGDYARKINHAAQRSDAQWFFTGADDLVFHPGWLNAAIRQHVRTGALVVGTNDLSNPYVMRGLYATHLLVHRDWLALGTVDEPGVIFHEGYSHNCVDTELVETAKARRKWAFAKTAHVEHMHPTFRKGHDDPTYRKGREHHADDRRLLNQRRPLWAKVQRRSGRVARGLA